MKKKKAIMTALQAIQEIQHVFNVNAIYANRVYNQVGQDDIIAGASAIIEERPKPFIKWVGGKRQLLKQFQSLGLYPPAKFDPTKGQYFEPFLGGGAVFFDLLPEKAFLSDLNAELVVTYNIIKGSIDELIKSLKKHKYEKDYFLKVRSKDPKELSPVEMASRFIFLNRTCFNGMYRVNSKGEFNVPFGRYSNPIICDEVNLRRTSKCLQNVQIIHQDYKQAVKKARKGDFIYFDPPYDPVSKTALFTSYTSNQFIEADQLELRDVVVDLDQRGCFVMLSNSDTPFINDIYSKTKSKSIKIIKVTAGRAINSVASKRGKITEILVTNYQ
jgi:DNA adenine methylase